MKFKGFTLYCDECDREYSEWDDVGYEDEQICPVCGSARYKAFIESLCEVCGKPIGKTPDVFVNCDGLYAHKECVENLPEEQQIEEEWNPIWD